MNGGVQVAVAPQATAYENGSSNGLGDQPVKAEDAANESAEEDDVREELEREVDALMADKVYHEFVENVVTHKVIAEEEHDGDYEVEEEVVDGGGDANEEDAGALSDSSSSTLTDAEDYEDAQEELDVKIPKDALMEAQQRFPPFWRLKHAMKAESMTDYKSDEDPDYKTEEEEDNDEEQEIKTADEAGEWRKGEADDQEEAIEADIAGSSDDESIGEEEDIDVDAMRAEVAVLNYEKSKDLKDDVDGLVEMVEYMTLPPSAAEDASCAGAVEDQEDMDEEDVADAAGQSILELDVDGYVSDEDPDFKPDPEVLELADNDSTGSSSSSSDEEEVADEGVERME